ncbi:MAG TPA: hypothetical protein VGV59_10155 [Pyrinomonadaceae bacterium]|nr:hypothetical protein [Pyrinomonadaceae bacterium]
MVYQFIGHNIQLDRAVGVGEQAQLDLLIFRFGELAEQVLP